MNALHLDPGTTALVLVDLQKGVVSRLLAPHSAADVVSRSAALAARCRELKMTVVLVHVGFSADRRDVLAPAADAPRPADAPQPADWSELVPEIGPRAGDLMIQKRQWGAFYGTDLDLQLRRRGVRTLVIGGIATNFGVESTVRDAFERGYEQVLVEDAMSGLSEEAHRFAIGTIFPRLGRVRSTADVLQALAATAEPSPPRSPSPGPPTPAPGEGEALTELAVRVSEAGE